MKKRLLTIITALIAAVLAFGLVGCGEAAAGGARAETQKITVYNGKTPVEYTVTVGEEVKLDTFSRNGYYLTGFYDDETEGTKYFDAYGKSLSVWDKTNPNVFYARFEDIDELQPFTEIKCDEKTTKLTDGSTFTGTFNISGEYKSAFGANLDREFSVFVSYDAITDWSEWRDPFDGYITTNTDGGEKYWISKTSDGKVLNTSTYTTVSKTFTFTGRQLKSGNLIIKLSTRSYFGLGSGPIKHVKNITLTISLISEDAGTED